MAVTPPHPDGILTVGSVWRRSRNALAREFRQAVWVAGEIKSFREWRGNLYLTLIEPGGNSDGSDITLDVSCTPKRYLVLKTQLAQAGISLASGLQVLINGPVTVGRAGKVQVEMLHLDISALIGAHALERRRVIAALQADGLIDRNRNLEVPLVPLRIGLVGSDGSDGVKDFLGRLEHSGYAFTVVMRHSPVQGPAAPSALTEAIRSLAAEPVDVLVIVRGGGGELDAFDKEPVVRAIATSPHPVWAGIGHTADQSLSDRVSNHSCVTPTACATALAERVNDYRQGVLERLRHVNRLVVHEQLRASENVRHVVARLSRHASTWASEHHNRLHDTLRHIERGGRYSLDQRSVALGTSVQALNAAVKRALHSHTADVAMQRQQFRLLDPSRQLERGYAIARRADGSVIRDAGFIEVGEGIELTVGRGKLGATVTRVELLGESS